MERISINKPLRVKAIYFKGKSQPLRNRLVWVAGNFLVVAQDEFDAAPTWYNVDRVSELVGVEQIREEPQTRLQTMFLKVYN